MGTDIESGLYCRVLPLPPLSAPNPNLRGTFEPGRVLGPGLGRDVLTDGVQEVGQELLPQRGLLAGEQLPGGLDDLHMRPVEHAEEATDVTHVCHENRGHTKKPSVLGVSPGKTHDCGWREKGLPHVQPLSIRGAAKSRHCSGLQSDPTPTSTVLWTSNLAPTPQGGVRTDERDMACASENKSATQANGLLPFSLLQTKPPCLWTSHETFLSSSSTHFTAVPRRLFTCAAKRQAPRAST